MDNFIIWDVEVSTRLVTYGQLFKRSLASVWQNSVLSHFQFAERFFVNIIFREKFNDSIKRWLEK